MRIDRNSQRLTGVELEGATYSGLDLRGAVAQSSVWKNCIFDRVNFGQAALGDASFLGCKFHDCDFRQATLVSRIYNSTFIRCDFDQALFSGADIRETAFHRSRFQYANFWRATLNDVVFLDCDLHGTNLTFAVSNSVDFTGSNLWSAVVPLNCAFLVGNTFDREQVHRFLALLLHGKGEWREEVLRVVDARLKGRVDRLVGAFLSEEGGDEVGPPGLADACGGQAEVGADGEAQRRPVFAPGTANFPRRVDRAAAEELPGPINGQ